MASPKSAGASVPHPAHRSHEDHTAAGPLPGRTPRQKSRHRPPASPRGGTLGDTLTDDAVRISGRVLPYLRGELAG